jgi:putative membrane protein
MRQALTLRDSRPAVLSAATASTTALWLLIAGGAGPLSLHMALHIASMNVVAPMLAVLLSAQNDRGGRAGTAWGAAALQVALLWAWHAPSVQRLVLDANALQAAAHLALLVAAVWSWQSLLRLSPNARWHAIPILLVMGKLVCLLAVLLIFSPRLLYELPHHAHMAAGSGLDDQQLAGLLMVVACPLSYVVAGVVFATQVVMRLPASEPAAPPTEEPQWRAARR